MKSRRLRLKQICQQFGVLTLHAFGSQAKKIGNLVEGHQDALPLSSSDMGIGVRALSGEKFSVTEKVNLALALEDLFGCKRVDLVSFLGHQRIPFKVRLECLLRQVFITAFFAFLFAVLPIKSRRELPLFRGSNSAFL
jgi:predicted nucleotidyltransferase